jgi:SAM-dependent methyltransferase
LSPGLGASRRFEYLDPDALMARPEFRDVERFLRATRRREIGWHYVIDLTWIYGQARGWPQGGRVLDAGGGAGPAQFLLAEMGFDVVNVDLAHTLPRAPWRRRYAVSLERLPSYEPTAYVDHLRATYGKAGSPRWRLLGDLRKRWRVGRWRTAAGLRSAPGALRLVEGNVCAMPELADGSFDAVVSLSALEHVPAAELPRALAEIRRVLKPGAAWAVTTSATPLPQSWFHEPSRGWCFSADDLARHFNATGMASDAAQVLEHYRGCAYLREHLAGFYRKSGQNGMPWGKWDPQYVPVGIR